VPGVWIQIHHIDLNYYEQYFQNGITDAHRQHDNLWHA
jgi:hypothetical protein